MSDEPQTVAQDEIEALLRQAKQAGQEGSSSKDGGDGEVPGKGASHAGAGTEGKTHGEAPPATTARNPSVEDAPDDRLLGQEEIEKLLASKKKVAPVTRPGMKESAAAAAEESAIAPEDMEFLLDQTEKALASVAANAPLPSNIRPFELTELGGAKPSTEIATFELIRDVYLDLRIELGRTHMHLEDVLKLRKGSVVALDKLAGDPVDVYVNGRLIARGEVLVLNDNFCVRVAELIAAEPAVA